MELGGTRTDEDGWMGEVLYGDQGSVYSLAGDESPGSERVILRHRVSSFALGMAWRSGMRKLPVYDNSYL